MDALTQLLANILDKFKTGNPKVFAIIQILLLAAHYVGEQLIEHEEILGIEASDTIGQIVSWLSVIIMIVVGSRTVAYLPAEKRQKLKVNKPGRRDHMQYND